MSISTTSRIEGEYLLIESVGVVNNLDDEKLILLQCYEEFAKTNSKRVLLDQTKVAFLSSITDMFDVVDTYSEDFPGLREIRVAAVVVTNPLGLGQLKC